MGGGLGERGGVLAAQEVESGWRCQGCWREEGGDWDEGGEGWGSGSWRMEAEEVVGMIDWGGGEGSCVKVEMAYR